MLFAMVSFLLEVPVGRFGQGAGEGAGQALEVLQMLWWLLAEFVWRCTWGAGQAVVGQGAVVAMLVRGCWSSAPGAVVVAGGACLAVQSGCLSAGQGAPVVRVCRSGLVRVLVRGLLRMMIKSLRCCGGCCWDLFCDAAGVPRRAECETSSTF